jgi:hypothetical protein
MMPVHMERWKNICLSGFPRDAYTGTSSRNRKRDRMFSIEIDVKRLIDFSISIRKYVIAFTLNKLLICITLFLFFRNIEFIESECCSTLNSTSYGTEMFFWICIEWM